MIRNLSLLVLDWMYGSRKFAYGRFAPVQTFPAGA